MTCLNSLVSPPIESRSSVLKAGSSSNIDKLKRMHVLLYRSSGRGSLRLAPIIYRRQQHSTMAENRLVLEEPGEDVYLYLWQQAAFFVPAGAELCSAPDDLKGWAAADSLRLRLGQLEHASFSGQE